MRLLDAGFGAGPVVVCEVRDGLMLFWNGRFMRLLAIDCYGPMRITGAYGLFRNAR